jgi:hypothetical protein
MWFELTPADYPHEGIFMPGWTHVSPDGDGGSRAYILESLVTGARQGYFLDSGYTSLDVEGIEFGPYLVKCIGGAVYLVTEAGIAATPFEMVGYMQLIEQPEMLVFCSYYELLVIHKSGKVRYFRHEDYYYADVLELNGDALHLSGKPLGRQDEVPLTMLITDMPFVKELTFK